MTAKNVGEEVDAEVTDTSRKSEGDLQEITTTAQIPVRDQARIEQLRGSITKIQDQIEKTRRELDTVCDGLRRAEISEGIDTPRSVSLATNNGDATANTVVSRRESASSLSNEQIIEKARTTVNGHIKMLTRYNEMKDVAMSLFELIAQHKGVRLGEVLRDEGVELDD